MDWCGNGHQNGYEKQIKTLVIRPLVRARLFESMPDPLPQLPYCGLLDEAVRW